MNFNIAVSASLLVGVTVVLYLIVTLRKASKYNMPFFRALNPNYTARYHELLQVRKSILPIIDEMETKRLSNLIVSWKNKFEKGTLSVSDVEDLNQRIADGAQNQVDGILSLHPEARRMFEEINLQLVPEEVAEEALVD